MGLWFQTCAASRSARADGCVAVATGSLALGAGNLLLWSAFGSCIRVRSGHCRSPRLASAHFPTFIATNATRAIPAITNMTPALKIAPIASHPDVSALTTTVARTGRTRRAEIEVLISLGKLWKREVAELRKLRLVIAHGGHKRPRRQIWRLQHASQLLERVDDVRVLRIPCLAMPRAHRNLALGLGFMSLLPTCG